MFALSAGMAPPGSEGSEMATEFQAAAAEMVPVLVKLDAELRSLAAPQASRLSDRIGILLDDLADLGEAVTEFKPVAVGA